MMECPGCGADFVVAVQDITPRQPPRRPTAGDVGVCQSCGCAFRLEPDGTFRPLTPSDLVQLPDEDIMIAILAAQQEVRDRR